MASLAMVALLTACDKADNDSVIVNDAPNDQFKTLVISAEQQAGQAVSNDADKVLFESLTSGICEIRVEQQFLRLIDPRNDDNPNDAWCVLRGATGNNPYIGYAPVTNAEYKTFKPDFNYMASQDNFPVVNITYADATAYCEWLGTSDSHHLYRLPSEEDWIIGAGHMPKDVSMNSNHVESGMTAVDAYKQTTGACGGIDFWGNCWEWTSTQTDNGEYVIKGGSWDSSRDQCRSEYSGDTRNGSQGYANVGFRVVRIDK